MLVHEPHGDRKGEAALFFLLHYLQSAYPQIFAKIYIFLEGQPHPYDSSYPFLHPTLQNGGNIDTMIQESYRTWKNDQYLPLNQVSNDVDILTLYNKIREFLQKSGYSPNVLDGRWDAALKFYAHRDPSGALDLLTAIENHLKAQIDKQINIRGTQALLLRISSLAPEDAQFAQWLIKDMGLRGAFSYKLYIEGATTMTDSRNNKSKIAIYGLEDNGLYNASCILLPDCLGNRQATSKPMSDKAWKLIQPYRDWVMARSALKTLEQLDQSIVPIITASVWTHLPLMREVFCREGYNTVTLDINQKWSPPETWSATTPIMGFLGSPVSSIPKRRGKLAPGISQESGAIPRLIDILIKKPGLL
jgi:hypothetical protein